MPDVQAVTASGGATTLNRTEVAGLRAGLQGAPVLEGYPAYDEARRVWNGLIDRRPAQIAHCVDTADVVEAVGFARDHNLLVTVRSGGHNVAGSAVSDGGLVVDLSEMRRVQVDPKSRTARVQGGATWADVDRETQRFGLATPGGEVSMTGVAGLTLGGGLGLLMRKHGLSCDNVRSVEIATADGHVRTARQGENSERLMEIKRRYDPKGLFSLQPAGQGGSKASIAA